MATSLIAKARDYKLSADALKSESAYRRQEWLSKRFPIQISVRPPLAALAYRRGIAAKAARYWPVRGTIRRVGDL